MKKKAAMGIGIAVAVLFVIYTIFIYFLVSACLVPSFMEKLDAFEEITEKGYSEQVHTSDISENRKAALLKTKEWLETAKGQKLRNRTADGYELVATEFYAKEDSHRWVLLLHGYTGWKEEMYPFAYRYYAERSSAFWKSRDFSRNDVVIFARKCFASSLQSSLY